jgi:hypothetical protein
MRPFTERFFSDEFQNCMHECQSTGASHPYCERLCTGAYLRQVFQDISQTAQENNISPSVLMEAFRSEFKTVFNVEVTFHTAVREQTRANGV